MKKNTLLFDLDGTLAHTLPQLAIAAGRVAEKMGYYVPSAQEIGTYVGNGANMLLVRTLKHSFDVSIDDLEPHVLKEAREHFNTLYLDGITSNYTIYDGVSYGLRHFKDLGFKIAVITNKPQIFAIPLLEHMQVLNLFDYVLGGEVLDRKKPDPYPLTFVLEKLGSSVEGSLMVGDSVNDIKAGQNCSMDTVGFSYGYNMGQDIRLCRPTYAFDSFHELIELIDSMYAK